jgi:cell division protein FtsW (lipid II flippase)
MTRALLQAAELAAMTGIAVGAHGYVTRRRGPLADALVATAGNSMRAMMAIADVVAALVYVAFASAVIPSTGAVGEREVESVLHTIAAFALVVAVVQVVSQLVLHRVAAHLEPWPPAVGSAA